ncbi:MAG: response regulator [Victivallales bacterium]
MSANYPITRILIVDENKENGELLCRQLKTYNRHIVLADTTSKAWKTICEYQHDVIFIDTDVKGDKAINLLKRLHEDDSYRATIFVMSENDNLSKRISCFIYGAKKYFLKPLNVSEINNELTLIENRNNCDNSKLIS